MAGALKEEAPLRRIYDALQTKTINTIFTTIHELNMAASCPWVEGLDLQDADCMLQLLTVPSQHRTNILAWICFSINPNLCNSKATSRTPGDPDVLAREMAVLGQELMLCKADDLDLIEGSASVHRQIQFLDQLLTVVPANKTSAGPRKDAEMLLEELYAAENLPHLSQMLNPVFDPWAAHTKTLEKGNNRSSNPSREEAADVATLLQMTQLALEQLQSECEFFNNEPQTPCVFSPSSLRVAACDLQQLIAAFTHVFETDLRAYCSLDPCSFSTETDVFKRVHQMLQACITELEMLKEVSEASVSVNKDLEQLQSRGQKHTLQDQLEEVAKRISDFLCLLHS